MTTMLQAKGYWMIRKLLEKLFDKLDAHLHKSTYLDQQDEILSLEDDIEKLENKIEMYEDNVERERDCDF